MNKILLSTLVFVITSNVSAESLQLQTQVEKDTAIAINIASDKLSENVMSCVENNEGKMDGCTCETREVCPYKVEFDSFVDSYCSAVKTYPSWKTESLFWQVDGDLTGYNLATKNLEIHFGKYCEEST